MLIVVLCVAPFDILVLENCVLLKTEQKPTESDTNWQQEFELD